LLSGTASAKTITVQFTVAAPAGTYCLSVQNGIDRSYVAEYTITAGQANVLTTKSVTLAMDTIGTWPTNNTTAIVLTWTLFAGSDFRAAAGAWVAGNKVATANQFNFANSVSNVFALFDVSLTEGTVAPPFRVPDYASELTLCQRYYEKSFPMSTPVAQNAGAAGCAHINPSMTTLWQTQPFQFRARKRSAPTMLGYNPSANNSFLRNGSANTDLSGGPIQATEWGFSIQMQAAPTAGQDYFQHWTANARL
jgi:hypothetical protein